jgi:hypothetical protein
MISTTVEWLADRERLRTTLEGDASRGASGTGKTRLSYRLARALNIGITEVDNSRSFWSA